MVDSADLDVLRRRWRQSLSTVSLLGADFVSLGRGSAREFPETVEPATPDSTTQPPATIPVGDAPPLLFQMATEPRAHSVVEAKHAEWASSRSKQSVPRDPETAQRLLDLIRAKYEADAPHAKFVTDHHSIVFGEGDPCARLMFIGEAPGADEDRLGRPFVGRAGQLLDKMITAMGLRRDEVYIANVLKTRPPNNATPTTDESTLCAPYLFDQIKVIQPEVIVSLGNPASRLLLKTTVPMGAMRGRWWHFEYDGPGCGVPDVLALSPDIRAWVMPTYHPAYLLRNYTPNDRAKVWSDLLLAMERLGLKPPKKMPLPASESI